MPGVEHRPGEHGRHRRAARQDHAGRRDLRPAREDSRRQRDRRPPGQPAAYGRGPELENGTGNPSLETLWALGTALGIPLSRLIDPPRSGIHVIRAGEGAVLHAEQDSYEAVMLASGPPGTRRDIYRAAAEPGAGHLARPHSPGTVEHVILGTGRALAGPEGEAVELAPGDYLRYPGDVPHVFDALEPGTLAVFVMEHVS